MSGKVLAGWFGGAVVVGVLWYVQMDQWNAKEVPQEAFRPLIDVGDPQDRVYEILGTPSIEFPKEGSVLQWYEGYEITVSNNVVTEVRMKPTE